jgi:hypothetical protein
MKLDNNSCPTADELFDQAAQNAALHPAATGRTDEHDGYPDDAKPAFNRQVRDQAPSCDFAERVSEGIRTPDPRDHNAVL